jgi:hypothetical protein
VIFDLSFDLLPSKANSERLFGGRKCKKGYNTGTFTRLIYTKSACPASRKITQ